jgi:hypothetical protein
MRFAAGFLLGFLGGLFGVWYAAAHAEEPVPIEPNGYELWRSRTYTLSSDPPSGYQSWDDVPSPLLDLPGFQVTTGAQN